MPTYTYTCADCGDQLEVVQRMTDDPLSLCPACGGGLRKVFQPVGVVFKGSGFYRNDSRSGNGKTNGSTKSESKDTKDTSKSDSSSNGSKDSSSSGSSESSSSSSSSGSSSSGSGSSSSTTTKAAAS